ncbi:MAG: hypothetical protein NVSMB62_21520 [Acidobacteriaceae bacterium]
MLARVGLGPYVARLALLIYLLASPAQGRTQPQRCRAVREDPWPRPSPTGRPTMVEVTGIDHLYLTVSDLARSESFYDQVLFQTLGFRKSRFALSDEPHLHYFNRHFGVVLRPARVVAQHDPYAPGLHHLCLRVDSIAEVHAAAGQLRAVGLAASEPRLYPEYAPDYTATFLTDPDGVRIEITNYRQDRRERHDRW